MLNNKLKLIIKKESSYVCCNPYNKHALYHQQTAHSFILTVTLKLAFLLFRVKNFNSKDFGRKLNYCAQILFAVIYLTTNLFETCFELERIKAKHKVSYLL